MHRQALRSGLNRLLISLLMAVPAAPLLASDFSRPVQAPPSGAPDAASGSAPIQCPVPDELLYSEAVLPKLAERIAAQRRGGDSAPLAVTVVGAGSAAGFGMNSPERAYPMLLKEEVGQAMPGVDIDVTVLAKRGDKVADMLRRLRAEVIPRRPALLVWQVGAADAVSGVPINQFGQELRQGIEMLRKADIEVVLVDMQYSPFTDMLINAREYRGYIRWIARREQVPLLRRYEMMEYWSEESLIDLSAREPATRSRVAETVHRCVAARLAQVIRQAVEPLPR